MGTDSTLNKRTGIIIQARMGSHRLPGKVLMPIGQKPLLGLILERLKNLQTPAHVIVATTTKPEDDAIATYCSEKKVDCFRGSELDVLDRYYQCALYYHFDHIVRLTADNPFYDIVELDRLIKLHFDTGAEFSHSFETLPVGVGAEIFTFNALSESWFEGHAPHHREHVDEYLLEHPGHFLTKTLPPVPGKNRHDVRLTVDTQKDHLRAYYIVTNAKRRPVCTEEAISLAECFDNNGDCD